MERKKGVITYQSHGWRISFRSYQHQLKQRIRQSRPLGGKKNKNQLKYFEVFLKKLTTERSETISLDVGLVNEDFFRSIDRGDETIALLNVEPLDSALDLGREHTSSHGSWSKRHAHLGGRGQDAKSRCGEHFFSER